MAMSFLVNPFLAFANEYLTSKIYIRSNHSHSIYKTILKANMDQSQLRNKFLKTSSNESKRALTQRNCCLTLVRKAKKD